MLHQRKKTAGFSSPDEINPDYKLSEIFYSIQGEGLLQGLPMVFIRLSGCNLNCRFCDTKYALKGGKRMDLRKILLLVKKHSCKRACITGGEPFLQNLKPLVQSLKEKDFWVSAETNGTVWQKLSLDWLTVSPKKEGITLHHPRGYDKRFIKNASEFKYVITSVKDMDFIDKEIEKPVILQPVDNKIAVAKEIIMSLKKNDAENRFLRLQMHKITGIR